MLDKTKSNKIKRLKYLAIVPIIIGMLSYTSCEKEVQTEEVSFNKNETELFEKYLAEIEAKQEEGADLFDLISQYSVQTHNYLIEEAFEKSKAWNYLFNMTYVNEQPISEKEKNDEKNKLKENVLKNTYGAYIEKSKTEQGKLDWELLIEKVGILRKVVGNLDEITASEQKIIDEKIARINRNIEDKTLIISDGFRHKEINAIQ